MRLKRNVEARKAWAIRHGLDPERIVDDDYEGRRTRDGRLEYELRHVVEGADGPPAPGPGGGVVTVPHRVTVPSDDPIPPSWIT